MAPKWPRPAGFSNQCQAPSPLPLAATPRRNNLSLPATCFFTTGHLRDNIQINKQPVPSTIAHAIDPAAAAVRRQLARRYSAPQSQPLPGLSQPPPRIPPATPLSRNNLSLQSRSKKSGQIHEASRPRAKPVTRRITDTPRLPPAAVAR